MMRAALKLECEVFSLNISLSLRKLRLTKLAVDLIPDERL